MEKIYKNALKTSTPPFKDKSARITPKFLIKLPSLSLNLDQSTQILSEKKIPTQKKLKRKNRQ